MYTHNYTITIKVYIETSQIFYYDTHKFIKKNFFLVYVKMAEENVMFFENNDKSYTMVHLYINNNRYLEYIDSYNYYDIDVDKILFKKSDNEYITRYNDVNKMIVPLQLKIKNFYNELNTFANNNRVMFIYNDDKEFSRKCREIWNKIIELIGINNPIDFVDADDDADEFIMADVYENTSYVVEGNYGCSYNKVVIVLYSVINDYLKTLVQHRY